MSRLMTGGLTHREGISDGTEDPEAADVVGASEMTDGDDRLWAFSEDDVVELGDDGLPTELLLSGTETAIVTSSSSSVSVKSMTSLPEQVTDPSCFVGFGESENGSSLIIKTNSNGYR